MHIKFFTRDEEFINAAIDYVYQIQRTAESNLAIALSGGSTPKAFYKELAESGRINIGAIDFWQVDERYVPADNPASNRKMIKETLLSGTAQPGSFHFFNTDVSIKDALASYKEDIQKNLTKGLDLVILGIGTDGHTASLFPDSPALDESSSPVAHTTTGQFEIRDRLTLTFPAILNAKHILILLYGKEKESILHELIRGKKDWHQFPAKKLLTHPDLEIHIKY